MTGFCFGSRLNFFWGGFFNGRNDGKEQIYHFTEWKTIDKERAQRSSINGQENIILESNETKIEKKKTIGKFLMGMTKM